MDRPFYHDDSFLSAYGHPDTALHDYKLLKNMSVGFAEPYRNLKSFRSETDYYTPGSGDPSSLKLAAPELEKLIIQTGNGVITSPTPGQYLYGRGITEEQEGFADGFVKALDELHKLNQMQMPPPNVSIGAAGVSSCAAASSSVFGASLQQDTPVYTTLNSCNPNTNLAPASNYPTTTISYLPQYHHQPTTHHPHFQPSLHHPQRPKEEPQIVPDLQSSDGSPPMSPIDMEDQERIKAERKRLRNRLAATKCRRRKLERISRLEDKVKVLKSDNAGLSSTASLLREQVAQLKQKVMTHVSSGCQLMLTPKIKSF
ncbi:hypothetical protein DNTS_004469 [Danionella cerebrum]|uniref:BZIP domain-containing protein n=1 Tax=Danionella cerebrum TaxID=2873325 RepID=A0A553PZE9_9TELE|nr:hypothetical protein DNTS_004469 [Danionella translucida]